MGVEIQDDVKSSSVGYVLTEILQRLDTAKTSKEMNEKLLDDLKIVKSTINDHDKSIVMIAKVMEDNNKSTADLVETIKELQKNNMAFQKEYQESQNKHWKSQDQMMSKIENVLETMSKYEPRLLKIEDKQTNGCSYVLNFEKRRDNELIHWNEVKESFKKAIDKNREEIQELEKEVATQKEKVTVANKRIADLEANQLKGIWLIVTAFLGIFITFIKGSFK